MVKCKLLKVKKDKIEVREYINSNTSVYDLLDGKLSDCKKAFDNITNDLDESIKKKYFDYSLDYTVDDVGIEIYLYGIRYETDEEYYKRKKAQAVQDELTKKRNKEAKIKKEEADRKLYLELKKKYESKN